jgi:hypothetical protein
MYVFALVYAVLNTHVDEPGASNRYRYSGASHVLDLAMSVTA